MARPGDAPLRTPSQDEIDLLLRAAQLHAPLTMPTSVICRNCSWPYPCPTLLACEQALRNEDADQCDCARRGMAQYGAA